MGVLRTREKYERVYLEGDDAFRYMQETGSEDPSADPDPNTLYTADVEVLREPARLTAVGKQVNRILNLFGRQLEVNNG